jgi:hypothetical protein
VGQYQDGAGYKACERAKKLLHSIVSVIPNLRQKETPTEYCGYAIILGIYALDYAKTTRA